MIALSIEVKGLAKDLHSGNDGGVVSEPLSDLCRVLGTLCDSHNVQIPGFYDEVRHDTLQAAIARLEGSHEFSFEKYKRSLGVDKFTTGRSEQELLAARWCLPTLSVVDVRVGTAEEDENAHYRFGPTRFSVIPRAAVGKVSVRYVPNQNSSVLVDRLTRHVQHEFAKLRSGNAISVKVHSVGDWWEANLKSPLMKKAEEAVRDAWGVQPLLVREGGTMPVASDLEKMLNAPAFLLPMGQSSDSCHLANERIRRVNLFKGKAVIKKLLMSMATDV
jgi:Cys-Gly metallodipeptidase DUG1